MRSSRSRILSVVVAAAALLILMSPWRARHPEPGGAGDKAPRLLWFIPDGLRADPDLFDAFRWAREGKLPNLRRLMERGAYGFSKPAFPSHTPSCFATLLTGAYPEVHGVNDGPMRVEGRPLDAVSVGGFSSGAKLVEPIWVTLEGRMPGRVALLCVPGSTPPELERGMTIKGRWGSWGAEFHGLTFQDRADVPEGKLISRDSRMFFFGRGLTIYTSNAEASGWEGAPASFSPPLEARLECWGTPIHACIHDTVDDGKLSYDAITLSLDKRSPLATLRAGDWSPWLPLTLEWAIPGKELSMKVESSFRARIVYLRPDGRFRIRVLFDELNRHVTEPESAARDLREAVGPQVDFPDSFPPQLVFCQEDRRTFLEEAAMSLDWHREATKYILGTYSPDVFIGDTYAPNQMLTGRWWLGSIDPSSSRYGGVSDQERGKLWEEVHWLYRKVDDILGVLLDHAGDRTVVVLSSDHGAVPLNRKVRLNNLFAREGLLSFQKDARTGELTLDWQKTRAVYLQMFNVYVNPNGLAGPWRRGHGPEYENLRQRVDKLLVSLKDEGGTAPLEKIVRWEESRKELRLLEDRVGDLVIANRAGYGWSEELSEDLEVFVTPPETGYKQAVLADGAKGLWTPFVIAGPGIRKGHFLGGQTVDMVDQYPTIFRAMGLDPPSFVQGRALESVFEGQRPDAR